MHNPIKSEQKKKEQEMFSRLIVQNTTNEYQSTLD